MDRDNHEQEPDAREDPSAERDEPKNPVERFQALTSELHNLYDGIIRKLTGPELFDRVKHLEEVSTRALLSLSEEEYGQYLAGGEAYGLDPELEQVATTGGKVLEYFFNHYEWAATMPGSVHKRTTTYESSEGETYFRDTRCSVHEGKVVSRQHDLNPVKPRSIEERRERARAEREAGVNDLTMGERELTDLNATLRSQLEEARMMLELPTAALQQRLGINPEDPYSD